MNTTSLSRRHLLKIGALSMATIGLAACGGAPRFVSPTGPAVSAAEEARRRSGSTVAKRLTAAPATLDLAGTQAKTWAFKEFGARAPLHASLGDTLAVTLDNQLPQETTVHWHGLALRNDMDGIPMLTQDAVPAGGSFEYSFTLEHAGTYWFHPHVGTQLDRGLYAPLIIEDPNESVKYDEEWVIVLDDWLDGVTATPDEVLAELRQGMDMGDMGGMDMGGMDHGSMGDMGGMDMGSGDSGGMDGMDMSGGSGDDFMRMGNLLMGADSKLLGGDAGDVYYPLHLINSRPPKDPETFRAKPGTRVRLRIINAGGDTAYRFGIQGHELTVTHTDGFPVQPATAQSIVLGMGERYDAVVEVKDGAFAVIAEALGKRDQAFAVLRSSDGAKTPSAATTLSSERAPLTAADLKAADSVLLESKKADRELTLEMTGGMAKYDWGLNGKRYDMANPLRDALSLRAGERVGLTFKNSTEMWHPMHLHGHTYQHASGGPRKDTSIVLPGQSIRVEFDADNPGQWMSHCHNIYHGESGMMAVLAYQE